MKKIIMSLIVGSFLASSANAIILGSAASGKVLVPTLVGLISTTTSLPTMLVLDSGEEISSEELIAAATMEADEGILGQNIEILASELEVDAADLFISLRESAE